MIDVSHVTKRYAATVAVDDLSFHVARGEIVGFLGPNGAGKTTTMRMLTGFLPPSGGDITVHGHSVLTDSMAVRRCIGYLPENCPLYPEMRVSEYLAFRARLKGVRPRAVRGAVEGVVERCGLAEVRRRVIGQLSKGFRQRVGLADALVHDPELLVLDEPTVGLDPHQIRQVRELIRELGRDHTVVLSTHILPEVEMTCERVLILHGGRIAASDSPDNLRRLLQDGSRVVAEVQAQRGELLAAVAGLDDVREVEVEQRGGWLRLTLDSAGDGDPRPAVYELCASHHWPLRELRNEEKSLEDVFVSLTGAGRRGDAS